MSKAAEVQKERARLLEIFKNVDPSKAALIDGLIDEAAYLKIENAELRALMFDTGMVKVHPHHKELQKPVEAARQYRQNVNSYSVVIKTLNGILSKDAAPEEDEFDAWIKERNG